jgi:energy-coupling factor transport system permease protein
MNGNMILGQYYNANSWIHRLDPRTKLISLFVLMITVFIISNIYILAITLGLIFILIMSSQVPITRFLKSIKIMATLLIFTMLFQVLFNTQGKILASYSFDMKIINVAIIVGLLVFFVLIGKLTKKFRMFQFLIIAVAAMYLQTIALPTQSLFTYQVNIYDEGLFTALQVLLRIINLIMLSSLLTLTTKPTDLSNGLESLFKPLKHIGLNTSIFAMMISIALRFIPTLINEANRILKAQASRGVDFKEGKLDDKVKQIVSLLIPMFIIAYRRAEDLANAMEARGYIPGAERTSINLLKYHTADIFVFIVTLIALGGSIVSVILL